MEYIMSNLFIFQFQALSCPRQVHLWYIYLTYLGIEMFNLSEILCARHVGSSSQVCKLSDRLDILMQVMPCINARCGPSQGEVTLPFDYKNIFLIIFSFQADVIHFMGSNICLLSWFMKSNIRVSQDLQEGRSKSQQNTNWSTC